MDEEDNKEDVCACVCVHVGCTDERYFGRCALSLAQTPQPCHISQQLSTCHKLQMEGSRVEIPVYTREVDTEVPSATYKRVTSSVRAAAGVSYLLSLLHKWSYRHVGIFCVVKMY